MSDLPIHEFLFKYLLIVCHSVPVMASLSARTTCKDHLGLGNSFIADKFGLAAFVFSLVTNLWSTALISYKAWYAKL